MMQIYVFQLTDQEADFLQALLGFLRGPTCKQYNRKRYLQFRNQTKRKILNKSEVVAFFNRSTKYALILTQYNKIYKDLK